MRAPREPREPRDDRFEHPLSRRRPQQSARVRDELRDFRPLSIRTLDLECFLEEHSW
jgi:hypothetical protein